MKKFTFLAVVVAMLCSACSKSFDNGISTPESKYFYGYLKSTRTVMGANNAVHWVEGDLVSVFNKTTDNLQYEAVNVNETSATLEHKSGVRGEATLDHSYAIYPYDANATLNNDVVTTTIAASQEHNADANLQYAIMVAKSSNSAFNFSNATSLLRFDVKTAIAGATLQSIKVVSASTDIAGDVTIDMTAPAAVVASNGSKEITLDCGDATLDATPSSFYVALAPAEFAANDLKIIYTFTFDGEQKVLEYPVSAGMTVGAGQMKWTTLTVSEDFDANTSAPVMTIVETAAALVKALENGGSVVVTSDIALDATNIVNISESEEATITIPEDVTVTIQATSSVDLIKNYGKLTLQGAGKIVAGNDVNSRRCIYNYGEMVIDGVEFAQAYGAKGAAINNEGKMVIENATVDAKYYTIWNAGEGSELTINGGNFVSSNSSVSPSEDYCYAMTVRDGAKLIVNGGYFEGNHGVIHCYGGEATLNAGEFVCRGKYSGVSDWVLSAEGSNSKIAFSEANCTMTHQTKASNIYCEINGGSVTTF